MNEKLTAKDIRKAVKELEKHKVKPDGDRLITIEVENPRELTDFFAEKKREKDKKDKKIFEKIMSRFAEAVHYKIARDIKLYGVCVLETGNTDDLDEIVEIRKELDCIQEGKL